METEFVFISNQSTDKNLQKYYTNFKKLIDFIKERKLYAENSDFYNKKLRKLMILSLVIFMKNTIKKGRTLSQKIFPKLQFFLRINIICTKKINFLQYFFRLECFFEWRLE